MPESLAVVWARVALAQAQREHAAGLLSDAALAEYVERLEQARSLEQSLSRRRTAHLGTRTPRRAVVASETVLRDEG